MVWSNPQARRLFARCLSGTALCVALAPTAHAAQPVEATLAVQQSIESEAAASQVRIDQLSEQTRNALLAYRQAVTEADRLEQYNAQLERLVASQEAEVDTVRGELEELAVVQREIFPLMTQMVSGLGQFVSLDLPFLSQERVERVDELTQLMNRADVSTAEKYRRILEAYQIEIDYGRTLEAYRGIVEIQGQPVTVDFLRFGRLALLYQTLDRNQTGAWDSGAGTWVALADRYRQPVANALRIARNQSPPDLVMLPVPAPKEFD